jgi:hypothetical protein
VPLTSTGLPESFLNYWTAAYPTPPWGRSVDPGNVIGITVDALRLHPEVVRACCGFAPIPTGSAFLLLRSPCMERCHLFVGKDVELVLRVAGPWRGPRAPEFHRAARE